MTLLSNVVEFNNSSTINPKKVRQEKFRLTIRLSEDENYQLKKDAGKLSRSAFARKKLFGENISHRPPKSQRKKKQPTMSSQTIARLLGTFGESELATSMLAIAMAAQSGSLPVTPELEEKLDKACGDIDTMCAAMVFALGIKRKDYK